MRTLNVYYKAFEPSPTLVATIEVGDRHDKMNTFDLLELVYERTQNIHESWTGVIANEITFKVVHLTHHSRHGARSMSVGDQVTVSEGSSLGVYEVAGCGFEDVTNKRINVKDMF